MKIEKINENRVRFTFNHIDLQKNNVDVHSFMSNSIENQSLFLHLLDQAEKEIGFITDNYRLSIEALALSDGNFIITVTRIEKENLKSTRVQTHRKPIENSANVLIYQFSSFNDLCHLITFISKTMSKLADYFSYEKSIYSYNGQFFLILENLSEMLIPKLSGIISEFGTSISYSELIAYKIREYGELIKIA